MSTLRVDKIKGRTGTTVTIPDSQNLAVTGNVTVSGQQSFASGAQLNLQGIDVNTGTRGDVLYYDSSGKIAKLNVGGAGAVLKSDGTDVSWGAIGNAANVYYVTTNGADSVGQGGSIDTAWKTIKFACSNVGNPTATQPAVIFVKGGTYEEVSLPIVIPQFTTIVGDNLRATVIKPAAGLDSGGSVLNTRSTLFRMSNATIIQDLVLDGMGGYTPGSPAHAPENATIGGKYFELNPASAVSDKSPYIYNVTSFGDGATGAVIDGSVHGSGNRSMLFHTYTAIHSDGLGVWCKDNGNAELISIFTYYNQVGISATGGGKIRALNSSCSYGEFGVYAGGYDSTETTNDGAVKGTMLTYTNVLTTDFTLGEQITGATSGATAYVANVQSEPKRIYIVGKTGTFQANEVVTGGSSTATATLAAASFDTNQDGRILVTTFTTSADPGDSLEFATTDGNAYQIQTVSSVTANSVAYHVLVFSTSRPTPVAEDVVVKCRKEFSIVRLTGHDFLSVGTGDSTTTNWPNSPTQSPSAADQIITNSTDPGRVYHVSTDEQGNFYVGDYFKVDQATGKVTLDSSAFDLKGLESLQLGSVGGLIGAQINEFSTDTGLSQNSNDKVPTQRAVKTYVDALNSVSGNFTIAGNLTVSGTTTSVNTTNTNITDKLIELANGTTGSPSGDAGIVIERGTGDNIFIGWDESEDKISFFKGSFTGSTSGNLTSGGNVDVALGNIEASRITTNEIIERVNIDGGGGLTSTVAVNLATNAVHYYTTAAAGNWVFNARGSGSTALNTIMATGDVMTFTALATNGGTPRFLSGLEIDGVSQTIKWTSGTAPSAGNANSIDSYTFSIIKTANAVFTVIGAMTQYA